MTRPNASYTPQPMRIQARPGSPAERFYYRNSALPKGGWQKPEVIAPGISPKPLDDLIFHGGKIVPQMNLRTFFSAARIHGKRPTSTRSIRRTRWRCRTGSSTM